MECPLMTRHDLPAEKWRKSSHSGAQQGDCLETQVTDGGLVAVGDSKARVRGAFVCAPGVWESFIGAVKRGELGDV
ncbi:DUF397 domain-containing protein [Streptomyces sp. NPDC003077]|uniref:DUF397 domain-containing protein n=1 Tax=Streptomyces sp. NPDC003077 TaxID=3154443 RepID=UPI0033A3E563